MKKLLLILVVFGFVFWNCSDQITNVDSVKTDTESQLIKLPEPKSLDKIFDLLTFKVINGEKGGNLNFLGVYKSFPDFITIVSKIYFPPGSFEGIVKFTLQADPKYTAVIVGPHMEFKETLTMNLTFVGLDLSDVKNPDEVKFCYIADDGTVTPVENSGVVADVAKGVLLVKNAKITHFSRYGFIK